MGRRRPLERYFTTSSLEKVKNGEIDRSCIIELNKKINKYINKKNGLITKLIHLINCNSSRHKQYLLQVNIEAVDKELEELKNEKIKKIKYILKNI